MAQHTVLKRFSYAPDGLNTRRVTIGEVLSDIAAEYLPGLISEGYIVEGEAEASTHPETVDPEPPPPGPEATDPPPPPVDFDAMSDEALREFIKARDGAAPHHATGRAKLLTIARQE